MRALGSFFEFHVVPPSDENTSAFCVTYWISWLFRGFTDKLRISTVFGGLVSCMGVHVSPPSMVFQMPSPFVPTQTARESRGSMAIDVTDASARFATRKFCAASVLLKMSPSDEPT